MNEEIVMSWIFGFFSFMFGIIGNLISLSISFLFVYVCCCVVCRYLICSNNTEEWNSMKEDMKSGMRDLARTFRDAMPGVHASVKQWADEKINKKG